MQCKVSELMKMLCCIQVVQKEKLDLLVELIILKVVLRSVTIMSGELCVTRCGMTLMLV